MLERAVDAGLVQVGETGQVRPWHPLLSAAARAAATPGQRQELHARLAKVVDTAEARLRHKALAVSEPDELLAERLADAAEQAGSRGAVETALELAELALTRTPPESASRPARVLDLAVRLGTANEAQRMTDLLEHEIAAMPHGPTRGQSLLMLLEGMWGTHRAYRSGHRPRAGREHRRPAGPGRGAGGEVLHRERGQGLRPRAGGCLGGGGSDSRASGRRTTRS